MLIANARVVGRGRCHVLVRNGHIVGFPADVPPGEAVVDAAGRCLIPGLADPHLHLMATLAMDSSIDAGPLDARALRDRVRAQSAHGAVRVVGFRGEPGALLDRHALDRWCADAPLRLQYHAGHLWVLNSAALALLPPETSSQPPFERDAGGNLTGRVWRGDALLRGAMVDPAAAARLGRQLARWGVTAVTDTSATTNDAQASTLATVFAHLPQRITLMGGLALTPPRGGRWSLGAVKILLDEADLPPLDQLLSLVEAARAQSRAVAFHCVGYGELALAVCALATAGSVPGDRIEHGAMISPDMLPVLADLGLRVVTQPGFLRAHGERYLRDVPAAQQADLYRVRSLLAHGVPLALSSDSPYGPANPWANRLSAVHRLTSAGNAVNTDEAITPQVALACSVAPPEGLALHVGQAADLCLLRCQIDEADDLDPVDGTWIGGNAVYLRPAHRAEPLLATSNGPASAPAAHQAP